MLVMYEVSNHLSVEEVTKGRRWVELTSGEEAKAIALGKAALLCNIITIALVHPIGQVIFRRRASMGPCFMSTEDCS